VPHRSCGIAIAETFGVPSRPYQALRRGGITGKGACGAIRAGEQVLGELLGDPDPVGAVTPELRAAVTWFQDAWLTRLRANNPDEALTVRVSPFEDVVLEEAAFDLGVSATAFHWLDEIPALARIAALLRPGGWWVAMWNEFGDDNRPDPFHDATHELLGVPTGPSAGDRGIPFALDFEARLAALNRSGEFDLVEHKTSRWSLALDAGHTMALYATYSNVNARSDRDEVLAELGRIAREDFGDRVIRNMVTSLYIARRAD